MQYKATCFDQMVDDKAHGMAKLDEFVWMEAHRAIAGASALGALLASRLLSL